MGLVPAWLRHSLHASLSNSSNISGLVSWYSEQGDWARGTLGTPLSLNMFTSTCFSCQCCIPVHQCPITWPYSLSNSRHAKLTQVSHWIGEEKTGREQRRRAQRREREGRKSGNARAWSSVRGGPHPGSRSGHASSHSWAKCHGSDGAPTPWVWIRLFF